MTDYKSCLLFTKKKCQSEMSFVTSSSLAFPVDMLVLCAAQRMKVAVGWCMCVRECVCRGHERLIRVMHDLFCVTSLSVYNFHIGLNTKIANLSYITKFFRRSHLNWPHEIMLRKFQNLFKKIKDIFWGFCRQINDKVKCYIHLMGIFFCNKMG